MSSIDFGDGYAGDIDSSGEESLESITLSSTSERKKRKNRSRQTKSCKRRQTVISPIHPDIDISLTRHMTSSSALDGHFLANKIILPNENPAASLENLTHILVDYFSGMRPRASENSVENCLVITSAEESDQCSEPNVILDISPWEQGSWQAGQHCFLEDALSLTSFPRLV